MSTVIHECKEDGDLPASHIMAQAQGVLYAHSVMGWLLLPPGYRTLGVNGNTYCYDTEDFNDE